MNWWSTAFKDWLLRACISGVWAVWKLIIKCWESNVAPVCLTTTFLSISIQHHLQHHLQRSHIRSSSVWTIFSTSLMFRFGSCWRAADFDSFKQFFSKRLLSSAIKKHGGCLIRDFSDDSPVRTRTMAIHVVLCFNIVLISLGLRKVGCWTFHVMKLVYIKLQLVFIVPPIKFLSSSVTKKKPQHNTNHSDHIKQWKCASSGG